VATPNQINAEAGPPMNVRSADTGAGRVRVTALLPFFLITFGIAWGIFALYIYRTEQVVAIFGELTGRHPLFILAVWAPAIAACIVIASTTGADGLRRYLRRVLLWRCPGGWYIFLLVGVPLIFVAGSLLKGNISEWEFPFDSLSTLVIALLLTLVTGPVEEFGWRGVALPLLQRKFAPIWASLILGTIWGAWHLPAFMLSGTPQSAWEFTPFLIGSITLSVIVTPMFNASRGSILLPALFHAQLNNPIWPDAQPFDTYVLVVVALAVVLIHRKAMFSRTGAATQVAPPDAPAASPTKESPTH